MKRFHSFCFLYAQRKGRRFLPLMLSLLLVLLPLLGSAQVFATKESSKAEAAPAKQEVIYAFLDESGAVKQPLIVVNRYRLDQAQEICDYGSYEDIKRLVGESELTQEGDKIAALAGPGEWYYQGSLRKELPWNFHFRMTLDGQERSAEELSGAQGKLELELSVEPNPQAKGKLADQFMLLVNLTLDNQRVTNLSAPGFIQSAAGANTMLTALAFPGEKSSFRFTADVNDFAMSRPQIVAMPMSLDLSELNLPVDKMFGMVLAPGENPQEAKNFDSRKTAELYGQFLDLSSEVMGEDLSKIAPLLQQMKDLKLPGTLELKMFSRNLEQSKLDAEDKAANEAMDRLAKMAETLPAGQAESMKKDLDLLRNAYFSKMMIVNQTAGKFRELAPSISAAASLDETDLAKLQETLAKVGQLQGLLSENKTTFRRSIDSLKTLMAAIRDDQLGDYLNSLTPAVKARSFVSDKNKNVSSLQFTILAAEIPKKEKSTEKADGQPEEDKANESKSFAELLGDLFSPATESQASEPAGNKQEEGDREKPQG